MNILPVTHSLHTLVKWLKFPDACLDMMSVPHKLIPITFSGLSTGIRPSTHEANVNCIIESHLFLSHGFFFFFFSAFSFALVCTTAY